MERVGEVAKLRQSVGAARARGGRVGFVPTMGALHAGHLSLVERARELADFVVLSIFVNPTQFGPGEDYAAYPRDLDGDAALAAAAGVDLLFLPERAEVYPAGYSTYVRVEGLEDRLCGRTRPGHFRGVATVVMKLLGMVAPDTLLLGQKDAQQLVLLRRMVRDLDLAVAVVGCPIRREPDGLALSSRNVYLSAAERMSALGLIRALRAASSRFAAGERDGPALRQAMVAVLTADPTLRLDYAEVVDLEELEPLAVVTGRALLAVAAYSGRTRLIDNVIVDSAAPESGEQSC